MDVAILGFGFLGKNLVKYLTIRWDELKRIDPNFKVTAIANSKGYIYDSNGIDLFQLSETQDLTSYSKAPFCFEQAATLIEREFFDCVFELTPTNVKNGEPGLSHIRKSLSRGMNVITANKGPLVLAYNELVSLAKTNDCLLLFEATVAGAVPVFSLVRESLQGDKVIRIQGILNGTTNYILSRMYYEGVSFDIALREAQEKGLTERDFAYDIDGIDAACKVVILANAIMGRKAVLSDVKISGIRGINEEAISLAKKSGYAIKLIGEVEKDLRVSPRLVPLSHPLCVNGTLNSVQFICDIAGEITLVGHGSGKETVSALLNDLYTTLRAQAIKS
ncbi:hypothetical protein B9Q13_05240 [Candidatus Marsarchaeota G2 archaeon ECH_B_SAG-G16]|uniref:homoserine dehydrogenase n=1 Tax=Candidatus Marsarchaeota G2 archaeon ECH_B_SAG-G16 TaxID=1978167 RepID=A0A2R6C085_9ARCH|nr:MAG: hypothetical protein B9Q13_05240 [Candidatus Marsarchaeota G2 archaeon ECH_B_SAG-G16]